jgi:hypothetical protein
MAVAGSKRLYSFANEVLGNMKTTDRQIIGLSGEAVVTQAFLDIGLVFRELRKPDCGIDGHVELRKDEEMTGEFIAVQVKSGPSAFDESKDDGFVFRSDDDHLEYWLEHSLPVIIVLCDLDTRTCFWERVCENTIERTQKGGKVVVPRGQQIDAASYQALMNIGSFARPSRATTIMRSSDVSHAVAKRYSADIKVNGRLTKAEIAGEIRRLTREVQGTDYHRSVHTEERWRQSDAHCVWLFLYLAEEDRRDVNWICRSQWIDPNLSPENAPNRLSGENIGDDIIVDWSDRYHHVAALTREAQLSKGTYLRIVDDLVRRVDIQVQALDEVLGEFKGGVLMEDALVDRVRKLEPGLTEAYFEAIDMGLAPAECHEADQQFQSFVAQAHNAVVQLAFQRDSIPQNFIWTLETSLNHARELRPAVEYELAKITC